MMKVFIPLVLTYFSFITVYPSDGSPFTLASSGTLAPMWGIRTSEETPSPKDTKKRGVARLFVKKKESDDKTQSTEVPTEKEAKNHSQQGDSVQEDDDSEENPIECTTKYAPSFQARNFFDQFLRTVNTKDRNTLLKIFHAKPNLEKQLRQEHPREYYKNKALCKRKTLLHTLLEFTHQKVDADLKEQAHRFEKGQFAERQAAQARMSDLEKRVSTQEQALTAQAQQLLQHQKQQQELQAAHQAHLATTEKCMQDTKKINLALVGLTGISIAALALVATQAMASPKTSSVSVTKAS